MRQRLGLPPQPPGSFAPPDGRPLKTAWTESAWKALGRDSFDPRSVRCPARARTTFDPRTGLALRPLSTTFDPQNGCPSFSRACDLRPALTT